MQLLNKYALCAAAGMCLMGAASAQTVADGVNVVGSQPVSFLFEANKVAANLYLPKGFDSSKKYPAIVVSHPWGGVKEQTAGLYAQRLAQKGFVTLAYDASNYGQSEGQPRDFEDPDQRVKDIRNAVGYLASRPEVRKDSIGTLGICAGGGYTLHEAQTDPRVKAVAAVSAYDIGGAMRHGIIGAEVSEEQLKKTMDAVAGEWNNIAAGRKPVVFKLLPDKKDWTEKTDAFTKEAYSYYRKPRGASPNARNLGHLSSLGLHAVYYPLEHMNLIAPRPVLLIAGEKAQTLPFSKEAYAKAAEPKELMVIDGATHFALYDKEQYVGPIVEKLSEFYSKALSH